MRHRILIALLVSAGSASAARAQAITVQQPVIGVHSVRTTVSVPDRGTMFLGGVKRAGESRSNFGPLRAGTSTGLFREQAGTQVRPWIHDLRAMDEAVLAEAEQRSAASRRPPQLAGSAAHAYQSLQARHARRIAGR
jgi:hypothetical protein